MFFTLYIFRNCKISADFFKELFIWKREREHEWEGQREKEKESQADSMLNVEPDMGRNLTTLISWSWDHNLSWKQETDA